MIHATIILPLLVAKVSHGCIQSRIRGLCCDMQGLERAAPILESSYFRTSLLFVVTIRLVTESRTVPEEC